MERVASAWLRHLTARPRAQPAVGAELAQQRLDHHRAEIPRVLDATKDSSIPAQRSINTSITSPHRGRCRPQEPVKDRI